MSGLTKLCHYDTTTALFLEVIENAAFAVTPLCHYGTHFLSYKTDFTGIDVFWVFFLWIYVYCTIAHNAVLIYIAVQGASANT